MLNVIMLSVVAAKNDQIILVSTKHCNIEKVECLMFVGQMSVNLLPVGQMFVSQVSFCQMSTTKCLSAKYLPAKCQSA
jgi:hypothetical protein